MKTLILIICLIPSSAFASDLTHVQFEKEIGWQVLNLIDYGQTRDIGYQCNQTKVVQYHSFTESNPILGSCPTMGTINTYFFISAIGHYAITRYLKTYRNDWQNITLIVSMGFIQHNYTIGLKINF